MHRQAPNLPRGLNTQTSIISISWLLVAQAHGHYRLTRQVVFRASAATGLDGLLDLTSRSVARATLIVNSLLCLELETPQTCDDQIVFERYSLVSISQ